MSQSEKGQHLIQSINDENDDDFDAGPVETDPNDIDIDTVSNLDNQLVQNFEAKQKKPWLETCFLSRLFRTYDTHFLIAIALQYFNTGAKQAMMTLALQDMFKNEFLLEPETEQEYQALMVLPWTPKIFYGMITDTFPLCGSRKKSYIILLSTIQVICCSMIAFIRFGDAVPIVVLGTVINFTGAFMDVVVDGLMVQQQRIDPIYGSEELQSLSWAMYGVGGIAGSMFAGYTTQNNCNELTFIALATVGLLIAIVGCTMSKQLESSSEFIINMTLTDRIRQNFRDIKTGFKIKEFHRAILFFVILGILVPQFTDYFYYYLTDYAGISKFQYAMTNLASYFCLFFGAVIFNSLLRDKNIHFMMVLACLTNVFGAVTSLMLIIGWTFGISNFIFMMGSTAVSEVLYTLFITLPSQVIFAKMIPQNIEASLFAITTGLTNFANLFAAKQLGNFINHFIGANESNLQETLWELYAIQAVMCLLPILFIWLLPTKQQVEKVQKVIEFMEKDAEGQISAEERDINIKDLDPNVALALGIMSHRQAALVEPETAGLNQ